MSLQLYNYYKRIMEPFVPIAQNTVGMYVCGPTVYGSPHLGHARSSIIFDTLYRYLQYLGYTVRYVRNITDVGHLEDEVQEQGEDKLIKQSILEKKEPMELAQFYTSKYHQALRYLNVLYPSIEPLATGHIPEQLESIDTLLELGFAYEVQGSVYFDMQKFLAKHTKVYGALSGVSVEDMQNSIEKSVHNNEKKYSLDFALWKKADAIHLMKWRSKWTEHGFPGWHTECAVMSEKYLGIPFDIHGGGLDLQFPHHEAEIAQVYTLHNTLQANYWIYNNLITINHQKMSKSLGNFITLEDCFTGNHEKLTKGYSANVLRFFLLRSHYRSILDFTDDALQGTEKGLKKILNLLCNIEHKVLQHIFSVNKESKQEKIALIYSQLKNNFSYYATNLFFDDIHKTLIEAMYSIREKTGKAKEYLEELEHHMNNDMDTPAAIATLFAIDKYIEKLLEEEKEDIDSMVVFYVFCTVLLGLRTNQEATQTFNHLIDSIVEMRTKARADKNFALSDYLRDILLSANITIKDRKDGSSYWDLEEL